MATAGASPVVSAFLALVFAGLGVDVDRRPAPAVRGPVGAGGGPGAGVALLFPQGGTFPFRWPALVATLVACLGVGLLVPRQHRLVRTVAAMYALASVAVFLVPSPLGANLTRFGMYAAGPVLVALVPRRAAIAVLGPLLLFWQWSPSFDAILRAGRDASTERAFYVPLLQHLGSVDAENRRTEVVPTARHWETAFVAGTFPIARGWERQLDIRFKALFYDDDLTAEAYHQWLLDEGVDRVALADAPLDNAGEQEAALLEQGLPFLRPVWSDRHWRVWEVVDATGVIDGPATVVDTTADTRDARRAPSGRHHAAGAWLGVLADRSGRLRRADRRRVARCCAPCRPVGSRFPRGVGPAQRWCRSLRGRVTPVTGGRMCRLCDSDQGTVGAAGSVERTRMNMRMKPLAAIACAALAVTAFTACGDDDDDDTPRGGSVPAVTEGGAVSTPLETTMTTTS